MKGGILLLAIFSFVAYAAGGTVARLDGRIVGGESTTVEEYAHQISLVYFSSHRCGGAVISEYWVLTAAHCVATLSTSLMTYLQIRAGSSYRNTGGTLHDISTIKWHDGYDNEVLDNDVALMKVKLPFAFSDSIQPIQLAPTGYALVEGTLVTVTGFGRLTSGGALPTQLQYVEVPIIELNDCVDLYSDFNNVTETQICAGYSEGGKDACQGDSGGPLVHGYYLVGIVSWGDGCALALRPGVYASVAYFYEWIVENTGVSFD